MGKPRSHEELNRMNFAVSPALPEIERLWKELKDRGGFETLGHTELLTYLDQLEMTVRWASDEARIPRPGSPERPLSLAHVVVLQLLSRDPRKPVFAIAQATGLKPSTVSTVLMDFLSGGWAIYDWVAGIGANVWTLTPQGVTDAVLILRREHTEADLIGAPIPGGKADA